MEVEFPQMLMPFMVATVLLFSSLLVYGTAMHLDCACDGEADPKRFQRAWDSGRVPPSWRS